MELYQLRYFLTVAETEHLTHSAELLHIAQPSLTKVIHNLEAELGVPLFIHRGRRIVLSEYGQLFRDRLIPIMRELDGLSEELRRMMPDGGETIRLNVLAASAFITEAVVRYKRLHPEVRFEFTQNGKDDTCDISVTTHEWYGRTTAPEAPGDTNEFICAERIFLACPNEERFAGKDGIYLCEAAEESFISLSEARDFRVICDKLCRACGFHPNIIFESDSPNAVIGMISSGFGVGFWPEFTWGAPCENVTLLPIADAGFSRCLVISNEKSGSCGRAAADFFGFLCSYCADRAFGGEQPS